MRIGGKEKEALTSVYNDVLEEKRRHNKTNSRYEKNRTVVYD